MRQACKIEKKKPCKIALAKRQGLVQVLVEQTWCLVHSTIYVAEHKQIIELLFSNFFRIFSYISLCRKVINNKAHVPMFKTGWFTTEPGEWFQNKTRGKKWMIRLQMTHLHYKICCLTLRKKFKKHFYIYSFH